MPKFKLIDSKSEPLRIGGSILKFDTEEEASKFLLDYGYEKGKTFKSDIRKGLTEYRLRDYGKVWRFYPVLEA